MSLRPAWVCGRHGFRAALTSGICDLGQWNRAFGAKSLRSPQMKSEIVAPVSVELGGLARPDGGISAA